MTGSGQSTLRFLGLVAGPATAHPAASRTAPTRPAPTRPAPGGLHPLRWLGLAERPVRLEGHPRIRERVLANLHRRRRRDQVVAGSVAAVLGLVLLGIGMVRSPLLAVESVDVVGLDPDQHAAVLAAVGVTGGTNVLDVDLTAVGAEVEALPWVEHATVTRRLPSTVEIRVTDRRAVAAVDHLGATYLLDGEGMVLERTTDEDGTLARPTGGQALPRITVASTPVVGTRIDEPAAVASAAVAEAMPPALDAWVVAYQATPDGEVDATLRIATDEAPAEFVVHLGRVEAIAAKAATVAALVEETVRRGVRPTAFDVRIPDRPVVTR